MGLLFDGVFIILNKNFLLVIMSILLVIISNSVFGAGIEEINQYTTDMARETINRVNAHTDEKIAELDIKGNEYINLAEKKISDSARTTSILIFVSMTSSLCFALLFVEMIKNWIWKKKISIEPLIDLDGLMKDARLWVISQREKGYGNWKLGRELKKSGYDRLMIKKLLLETK